LSAGLFGSVVTALAIALGAAGAEAENIETGGMSPADLSRMSIEELANIEITTVSKKPERLSDAAAAVFVITNADIRRSGATSIPEILRLAPNLQVARVDASQYAITARGFNSTTANKLLVLIDGRSVYTPLFSGVFWDVQDVLLEDIDRIEVVSGPGGTLWGSNAVNGVINIITRNSRDTIGGVADLGGGTDERGAGVRYGARLGENAAYRLYGKTFGRDRTVDEGDVNREDSWSKGQGGFRTDWAGTGKDAFTFQGDIYDGSIDQKVFDDKTISGGNLLGRWNRVLGKGSAFQVQAYYDRTRRIYPGTFGEELDTYDIAAQHGFSLGAFNDIVWGGGYRLMRDDVTNSAALAFLPASRNLELSNIFLQDSITLHEHLQMTLGAKLEHNSYTGTEVQPSARLAWKLSDNSHLWSAVSRAVRTPSRLDRDLYAPGSPPFLIAGGSEFQSEKVTAYELGYRAQPTPSASYSIATFYNVYDELRSLEPTGGGAFVIGNKMAGETYGAELWANYRLLDWWQLGAGYNYLKERLHFDSDSGDTALRNAGNDPAYQVSARSTMDLPYNLEFDMAVRFVGSLPDPDVPDYVALDARLGWKIRKDLDISLIGNNLVDSDHTEFGTASARSSLGRTVYGRIQWKF
jgi:iron complex outermembrane receptor protein